MKHPAVAIVMEMAQDDDAPVVARIKVWLARPQRITKWTSRRRLSQQPCVSPPAIVHSRTPLLVQALSSSIPYLHSSRFIVSAMSSPPEAHDGIDRTVTPAHDIPIRRQKRALTTDVISDVWVEAQREALWKVKDGTRVISPRTADFVDDLLNQCDAALGEVSKNEYFHEIVESLQLSIPFLEKRLENDDKWAADLISFQKLGHDSVLLKYGDYYAEGCNMIRSLATGEDKEQIRGRRWSDILKELEAGDALMKTWHDEGETGTKPKQPIRDLLYNISLLWKDFDVEMLKAMMECYVERNGIAHNGLNELIKDRNWDQLAIQIRKDYHAVETFYPLPEHQEKAKLLKMVITACQDQFYEYIEEHTVDGEVKVKFSKLKAAIVLENDKQQQAKQKAKDEAENAAELEKLVLVNSDEELLTKSQMAELEAAQKDYQTLVDVEKEYVEKAKKRKVEEAAKETVRTEAAKAKILEAKARLEKAKPKKSNS